MAIEITQSEIDAADRVVDLTHNQVFYLIESRSNPGQHYKVIYNRQYKCLQCLPFDGEACPASVKGIPCRHKYIALAAEQEFKVLKQGEREAAARIEAEREAAEVQEQSEIERLVAQGLDRETAMRVAYAKPAPKGNAKAQSPKAFSLLK